MDPEIAAAGLLCALAIYNYASVKHKLVKKKRRRRRWRMLTIHRNRTGTSRLLGDSASDKPGHNQATSMVSKDVSMQFITSKEVSQRPDDGDLDVKAPTKEGGIDHGTGQKPPAARRDDVAGIRISNLSDITVVADLENLLKGLGPVKKRYLAKDKITGRCKGFAFVHFKFRSDAAKAIQFLNGYELHHLILNVEWSKPPAPGPTPTD